MSIIVTCSFCGKELNEPGAIIIPPPPFDRKLHMCKDQYKLLIEAFGDPSS